MLCDFYDEDLEYQENLMAKYLVKLNHEVFVLASFQQSIIDYYYNNENETMNVSNLSLSKDKRYKIIRLAYVGLIKKFRKLDKMVEVLNNIKPDLIFIHDLHNNIRDVVSYKKENPQVTLKMDCHADFTNSAKNWLSYYIQHRFIKKTLYLDLLIPYLSNIYAVVPATKDFLHELYKVSLNKISLLPMGADLDYIAELRSKDIFTETRKSLGISNNDTVIFTGGKLNSLKRTDLLLDAFHILNNEKIHIVVAGQGVEKEDFSYFRKLEGKLGSHVNIHKIGWVNTEMIYKLLLSSDLAVFPGSQSVLWLKAVACGLPLIIGKMKEQSVDYLNLYENMIIIKEENVNAFEIAKHIDGLIKNKVKYKRMCEAANRTSLELLDWNKLILEVLN